MNLTFSFFLSTLSFLPAAAEAPLVGRPSDHFYNAVGERVRVEVSARPTVLQVEQETQFNVRISGAENFDQVRRPDLRELDEFASRFHIDDLDDGPDSSLARSERTFRYRLRPKDERVTEIPPLLFRYWQPKLQYFAATVPETAIPLTVRARDADETTGLPLQEPEFLFEFATDSSVFLPPPKPLHASITIVLLSLPGLVCLGWYLTWRAANPGAARLSQLRRLRAVRLALDELRAMQGRTGAEYASQVADIMRNYLRDRWLLPVAATTPSEVAGALKNVPLPLSLVKQIEEFFRQCDAGKFGPNQPVTPTQSEDAEAVVSALETHAAELETSSAPRRRAVAPKLLFALILSLAASATLLADEIQHLVAGDLADARRLILAGMAARNNDAKARPMFGEAAEHYANLRTLFHVRTAVLQRSEGNARMLGGDLAGAIAAYRLGLLLDPDEPGFRRNLAFARSQVQFSSNDDRARFTRRPESFRQARHFLRAWGLPAIAIIACIGWIGLTRWFMVRNRRLLLLGGLALALAAIMAAAHFVEREHRAREAAIRIAVLAKPAMLRIGDGPNFPPRLETLLPIGVEATVHREWGNWLHVELADGTLGWLPREQVILSDPMLSG